MDPLKKKFLTFFQTLSDEELSRRIDICARQIERAFEIKDREQIIKLQAVNDTLHLARQFKELTR